MTTDDDRNYAMGVLAAKGAMRDAHAFAAICEQAEEVLAKETPRDEARRLRAALEEIASGLSVRLPFYIANEALGRAVTE